MKKQTVSITGIPETMLWTLHNRAYEAAHPENIIDDPKCLEIYHSLDYDYEKSFGRPDGSHGVRSHVFDNKIREFIKKHPDGVVINLGDGLETQRYRIATEKILWLSVDIPEAISIRERFIQSDEYHQHISTSALSNTWFDYVPTGRPVFITAQGLLMYFNEDQVQKLIKNIAENLPGAWLMFDYIPKWLSDRTLSKKGWMKTPSYRTPPMPWGIERPFVSTVFSNWMNKSVTAENVVFLYPRGWRRWFVLICEKYFPAIMNRMPGVAFIRTP